MTAGQELPHSNRDELAAKQFGRDVRRAIKFREQVFSRDPESAVAPADAAAVLGLQDEQLAAAIDDGWLRVVDIDGEQVIRVADLQAAFDEQTRRMEEAAKAWTQLQGQFGWDE